MGVGWRESDIIGAFSEPLGGVKNLQVTDPTTNSLRVRWEPAEGDVRQYNVLYVPAAGGAELTVGLRLCSPAQFNRSLALLRDSVTAEFKIKHQRAWVWFER